MRRIRVSTIPDIGLSSTDGPGETLQKRDSEIFADAGVEARLPEKRPTAPLMRGLRRRNVAAEEEEERYEDASQNESAQRERSANTGRMKRLTSLACPEDVSNLEEIVSLVKKKEHADNAKEDMIHAQSQEEQSLHDLGHSSIPIRGNGTSASPAASGSPFYTRSGKSINAHSSKSGEADSSNRTQANSSTDNPGMPRRRTPWRELAETVQTAFEYANGIRNRLRGDTFPRLQRKARAGISHVVADVLALFHFLKWASLTFFQFLDKYNFREIQETEKTNEVCLSDDISEVRRKDAERKIRAESTTRGQDEERTFLSLSVFERNADGVSGTEVQTESTLDGKKTKKTSKEMTRESHRPLHGPAMGCMADGQKAGPYEVDMTDKAPNVSKKDSGCRTGSQTIVGSSSDTGSGDSGSKSGPKLNSDCLNPAEDLMAELDQDSLRSELKQEEIILSPLDQANLTLASEAEFAVGSKKRVNDQPRGIDVAKQPRHRYTEMNQLVSLPDKKTISSRSSAGKWKSNVSIIKDTLFRAFERNKAEPETRFASPRSARKTLALIADMLVKEHGCDVAIRKNGALKLRCEKTFSGGQRLRVRLAFQPMDGFSCNVILCRSRDDYLQVSTTDYVAFIANIQRLFLNATSEGIHGTRSSS